MGAVQSCDEMRRMKCNEYGSGWHGSYGAGMLVCLA